MSPLVRPMPGHLVTIWALLAVVVAIAGCGATTGLPSAGAASAAPSPVPSGVPGSSGPAPSVTPVPAGQLTFDLPAGWRAIPVTGNHDELLASLRAQNPAFADALAARLENLSATTSYVALDLSPDAVQKGELVTLLVTEVALPPDVTLDAFAATIKSQVDRLADTEVQLRNVLLTAGPAISFAYGGQLPGADGTPGTPAVTEVCYTVPGRGYVLTFATPPDRANDYLKAIADIATSFTVQR